MVIDGAGGENVVGFREGAFVGEKVLDSFDVGPGDGARDGNVVGLALT